MTHQATRRAPLNAPPPPPPPTAASLESSCPLASLGRGGNVVLDALNGSGHLPPYHHHPLSSSPLDPQVYHARSSSPVLSIAADDIIYHAAGMIQPSLAGGDGADAVDGRLIDEIASMEEDASAAAAVAAAAATAAATTNGRGLCEMYRTSSHSSLEQALPVQRKAATFELRGRHHGGMGGMGGSAAGGGAVGMYATAGSSASVGRALPQQKHNYLALEHLLQYGPSAAYMLHSNGGTTADTEDSSDTAGGGGGNSSASGHLTRHQGGRCSVPTVVSGGSSAARNAAAQYFLEKKMDALYLGNTMRGLPLGSEAANHYPTNERFYLDDSYSNGSERLPDAAQRLLHHRASSPSETSGSERYLLNRTSSPSNAFSSSNHLDNFSSSNNNTSSSSNLALDQRFHHSVKVKSLSEGLCNLGRFSPSLDQGYATLVSPSPTGHHPNTITTHSIVHHTPPAVAIAATAVAATRRNAAVAAAVAAAAAAGNAVGPPPWNKKGPCRSGPLFDRLPDEAVLSILGWLDSCELYTVARVCRRFEQLSWRPMLWKVISLKGEHLNGDKTLKMIFRQLCGQSRNGSCPDVERVLLADGCRISDKGLQLLTRRCPELTHLQLHLCVNVSQQALMDVLTKCTNLQHLDVTGCTQVMSISPHPNVDPTRRLLLQYLDLTDCMAVDDVGLKIMVKNCPQLVYLYLRRCIQITDAGLKFVPSFCIALKELSVSDCVNITDFGLYELAKLGAALRYLSVAKCDRVSDAGLKVIARRCYKLRYLNARGCEAVSDDSITVLARSCPRLRALDIGKCDVSDAGLRALAESCPNLKKLSLRNCDMITDRGVQCIAYYCRGLQQLNIQDCSISIEGYRAVKKYCKRCIIEHTNPGFC